MSIDWAKLAAEAAAAAARAVVESLSRKD